MRFHFIYYIIMLIGIISCSKSTSNEFALNGKIGGLCDSTEILLSYMALRDGVWNRISEKTYSINDKFSFKGKINGLTVAFLDFENSSIDLYLEPTTVELYADKDSLWNYKLSGMTSDRDISLLSKRLESYNERLYRQTTEFFALVDSINSITEEGGHRDYLISLLTENSRQRHNYVREIDMVKYDFALENIDSRIAPVLTYSIARTNLIDIDKIIYLYDRLPDKSTNSVAGNLAKEQVKQAKKQSSGSDIAVGSIAPDFIAVDIHGNQVQLSEEIGQEYILLDFWASWCAPCLKELPILKDINSRFSGNGLKIISISVDTDKEQWISAVDNHELGMWRQILSSTDSKENYFAEDISNDYGVEKIPTYFLINQEGKIVAIWSQIGVTQIELITKLVQ